MIVTKRARLGVGAVLAAVLLGCGKREATPSRQETPAVEQGQSKASSKVKTRASALMGQFRYDDAVKLLDESCEEPGASDDLRVDLAIALLNRRTGDDLSRSEQILEEVITGDPDNARALYTRGLLHFHAGQIDRASERFGKVVRLDPQDAYAAYYVGQCGYTQGDHEQALEWFTRARDLDPYLRSACYGRFLSLQRLGRREEAKEAFGVFQKLGTNPRSRLAELKYSRMGPKAEVAAGSVSPAPAATPEGPIFEDPITAEISARDAFDWSSLRAGREAPNATFVDLDGDGDPDWFLSGAADEGRPLLLQNLGEGGLEPITSQLGSVTYVNTALWGDYDNDGLIDVYLCRSGFNQLWRQEAGGEWRDVTESTDAAAGSGDTIDGLCFDIDHDGDLDYVTLDSDGRRVVLNNDRDGGFRDVTEELGLAGDGREGARVLAADLDGDDDADLLFLNAQPPHDIYRNDRLWNYQPMPGCDELAAADIDAVVAVDADVDGSAELYTAGAGGVTRWTRAEDAWKPESLTDAAAHQVAGFDFNGNGSVDLLARQPDGWRVLSLPGGKEIAGLGLEQAEGDLGVLITDRGPAVVGFPESAPPVVWAPGPGRFPFTLVGFAGKIDKAAEMRSNASGIGVRGVARVGDHWAPLPESKRCSSAGQSHQPLAIGSAGAEKIEFIRLLWPDGVSQTEIDLPTGESRLLPETQRQAGSCPLVFVWDGERYVFVADVIGAGGIGFNLGRGEYYPPRPSESLLMPPDLLRPRAGAYEVKLGEPMEEICYFDAVRLMAYDLPPGWRMTLDERFGGLGPAPTGAPIFYRRRLPAARAINDLGEDVTSRVRDADNTAAPLARRDRRFTGLCEPHAITLEFGEDLSRLSDPTLLFNGWVEYAYSQSAFAAWQAGESFAEPTIEAQGEDGRWVVLIDRFGYPAGTSREGAVRLPRERLPAGTRRLRVSTNMLVFWDRLAVIDAGDCPDHRLSELRLAAADVRDVGFAEMTRHDQRRTVFDYAKRAPLGDTRHPAGWYTAHGEATELVEQTDDAVAIIGPGEELHLEFAGDELPPAPAGWTRRWVLETDGWCKDNDLFTQNAGTVGPLPRRNPGEESLSDRRETLHSRYNTRFRSGY